MSDRAASVPNDAAGLLSLSIVAASAAPIPVRDASQENSFAPSSYNAPGSIGTGSKVHTAYKHRRLSSSGQARRRLSDAREAASRPSPVQISTAAAALTSLAKLSLSGTPPPQGVSQASTTFVSASGVVQSPPSKPIPITRNGPKVEAEDEEIDLGDGFVSGPVKTEINGAGISVTSSKNGSKKRGTIFKCESCSKVYRHPSCLIKHRWEHSPHWREASKFLLSKHQQVQLLEAAAILSHLSPSEKGGTSLPEDRSLWPSYLSGGLLPPPTSTTFANDSASANQPSMSSFALEQSIPFPTSSSVPAPSVISRSSRSSSAGTSCLPRMYDYAIPATGGITQLRPGVLGVPTGSDTCPTPTSMPSTSIHDVEDSPVIQRSAAVPVPVPNGSSRVDFSIYRERDGGYSFVSAASDAWSSPVSVGFAQSSFRSSSVSALGQSYSDGTSGWSLPRSSIRSGSRSRSGSISESDYVDIDGDGDEFSANRYGFSARSRKMDEVVRAVSVGQEKIDEEWDGMELEMEM